MSGAMIAGGIASKLIDTATQFGMSAYNNQLAKEREEIAREQNFLYNQKAAKGAYGRTIDFYNTYQSPEALIRQYKEAGLSPSIMAGGAGQGGTATSMPMGEGASGVSPTIFGISALETAQMGLIKAQTKKVEEEAKTEAGENARGAEEIRQLVEDTEIKGLIKHYKSTENLLKQIELATTTDKALLEIDKLKKEVDYLDKQIYIATIDGEIKEETKKSIVEFINNQIKEQAERIFLMQAERSEKWSQVGLNKAQTKKLYNDVIVDWTQVGIEKSKVKLGRDELVAKVAQWAIENNFRTQENVREWAELVVDIIDKKENNFIDLLDAIMPF